MQGASRLVCAPFHKLSSLADADGPSCDASDAMRERGFRQQRSCVHSKLWVPVSAPPVEGFGKRVFHV